MTRWQRFKAWTRHQARRLKVWALGLLIAIGVITVPPAIGGTKDFSWQNPTEYTDGTPLPLSALASIRLFCNELEPITVAAPATNYTATLEPGDYECYATAVTVEGVSSFASNTITFTVDPLIPNAPILGE